MHFKGSDLCCSSRDTKDNIPSCSKTGFSHILKSNKYSERRLCTISSINLIVFIVRVSIYQIQFTYFLVNYTNWIFFVMQDIVSNIEPELLDLFFCT